jgi:hypothetical protein
VTAGTFDAQVTNLISQRHLADIGQRYQQNDTSSWQVVNGATAEPGGTITATHWKIGDQVKNILIEPGSFNVPGSPEDNTAFMNALVAAAPGANINLIMEAVKETARIDTHNGSPRPNPWKQALAFVAAIIITVLCEGVCGPAVLEAIGYAGANAAVTAVASTLVVTALTNLSNQLIINGRVNWAEFGQSLKGVITGNVKAALINALTAGVLDGLNIIPPGSGADWSTKLAYQVKTSLVSAGVSTAINGGNSEDFAKAFINSVVTKIGADLANQIGTVFGNNDSTYIQHKLAHALLGCLVAEAKQKGTCGAGALGAGISAIGAEWIATNIGTLFGVAGSDTNTVASEQALRLLTTILAKLAKVDVDTAVDAALNEFDNNYLMHTEAIEWLREINQCKARNQGTCPPAELTALADKYKEVSAANSAAMIACETRACLDFHIERMIDPYRATNAWGVPGAAGTEGDVLNQILQTYRTGETASGIDAYGILRGNPNNITAIINPLTGTVLYREDLDTALTIKIARGWLTPEEQVLVTRFDEKTKWIDRVVGRTLTSVERAQLLTVFLSSAGGNEALVAAKLFGNAASSAIGALASKLRSKTQVVVNDNRPPLSNSNTDGETVFQSGGPPKPQPFTNLYPEDVPRPASTISNDRLRSITQRGLAYVVLEDGTLIVGKNNQSQGHIDLAFGKPVIAAGEVDIVFGQIRQLNNKSGHYRPTGSSAQAAAEAAFRKYGLDATGKYKPFFK